MGIQMNDTKEMAAPDTSVGADVGQPLTEINTNITDEDAEYKKKLLEIQRFCDPMHLNTLSLNDLFDCSFPSKPPLIDGLLLLGTYLLAGSPKVGKSFLISQLAYHVSLGQTLWGYPVQQGGVLYLALEDDYARLQRRMSRMFGVEGTDDLHFAIASNQIDAGLTDQLDNFLREHPDTKLVIIDTLQKVRAAMNEAYSYANDYEAIGKLKSFAGSRGICLLLVHHTRKQPADDKFDMISGTTGLLGCADGALLLRKEKRTDLNATLDVVGRDQPDQRLHLLRDEETLAWQLDHAERELWKETIDPLLEKVAALLTEDNPSWEGRASELAVALQADILPNQLARRLNVARDKLAELYQIEYTAKRNKNGSFLALRRMAS